MSSVVILKPKDSRFNRFAPLFRHLEKRRIAIISRNFAEVFRFLILQRTNTPCLVLGIGWRSLIISTLCILFRRTCWIRLGGNPVLDKEIRAQESGYFQKILNLIESAFWRRSLKYFSKVYVVSHFLKISIEKYCSNDADFEIVEPEIITIPVHHYGNNQDCIRVYTLGNFSWRSKRTYFTETLREILGWRDYPKLKIDIYGNFPDPQLRSELNAICLQAKVRLDFCGFIANHSLIPDQYDLFFYFSEHCIFS